MNSVTLFRHSSDKGTGYDKDCEAIEAFPVDRELTRNSDSGGYRAVARSGHPVADHISTALCLANTISSAR
jgi:hypothetical protein